MMTNEVAFVAIAVSDKERARKFYQETLELTPDAHTNGWRMGRVRSWPRSPSALVVTRRGNLRATEQPSRSRWKILIMLTRSSKTAA